MKKNSINLSFPAVECNMLSIVDILLKYRLMSLYIAVAVGAFVFWQMRGYKAEYFLRTSDERIQKSASKGFIAPADIEQRLLNKINPSIAKLKAQKDVLIDWNSTLLYYRFGQSSFTILKSKIKDFSRFKLYYDNVSPRPSSDIQSLYNIVAADSSVATAISPVFSMPPGGTENYIIGLNITCPGNTSQAALDNLKFLIGYIYHTLEQESLSVYIESSTNYYNNIMFELEFDIDQLENSKINFKKKAELLQNKISSIYGYLSSPDVNKKDSESLSVGYQMLSQLGYLQIFSSNLVSLMDVDTLIEYKIKNRRYYYLLLQYYESLSVLFGNDMHNINFADDVLRLSLDFVNGLPTGESESLAKHSIMQFANNFAYYFKRICTPIAADKSLFVKQAKNQSVSLTFSIFIGLICGMLSAFIRHGLVLRNFHF